MIFSLSPLLIRHFIALTVSPAWVYILVASWKASCFRSSLAARSSRPSRRVLWDAGSTPSGALLGRMRASAMSVVSGTRWASATSKASSGLRECRSMLTALACWPWSAKNSAQRRSVEVGTGAAATPDAAEDAERRASSSATASRSSNSSPSKHRDRAPARSPPLRSSCTARGRSPCSRKYAAAARCEGASARSARVIASVSIPASMATRVAWSNRPTASRWRMASACLPMERSCLARCTAEGTSLVCITSREALSNSRRMQSRRVRSSPAPASLKRRAASSPLFCERANWPIHRVRSLSALRFTYSRSSAKRPFTASMRGTSCLAVPASS
mmetsp:Transcript_12553/g.48212  ORF Transcript_12553/g.48212 Transcript_12553/m.48212 type:complete len:331 (+) Transcript_12553:796-1788(+)